MTLNWRDIKECGLPRDMMLFLRLEHEDGKVQYAALTRDELRSFVGYVRLSAVYYVNPEEIKK